MITLVILPIRFSKDLTNFAIVVDVAIVVVRSHLFSRFLVGAVGGTHGHCCSFLVARRGTTLGVSIFTVDLRANNGRHRCGCGCRCDFGCRGQTIQDPGPRPGGQEREKKYRKQDIVHSMFESVPWSYFLVAASVFGICGHDFH